jgi:hypothetical protein
MAFDRKYGTIPIEGIPDDEPVIVFRAQDQTTPNVIVAAIKLAVMAGADLGHVASLLRAKVEIERWQQTSAGRTKVPDTDYPIGAPPVGELGWHEREGDPLRRTP